MLRWTQQKVISYINPISLSDLNVLFFMNPPYFGPVYEPAVVYLFISSGYTFTRPLSLLSCLEEGDAAAFYTVKPKGMLV